MTDIVEVGGAIALAPMDANGRKLGRKGQETRERILSAMLKLVRGSDGPRVTLTSVASEAAVRLPNLYLYFPDFGDLLLCALERVMAGAEEGFVALLRRRWPDEGLEAACHRFLEAHYAFWKDNARILHLRNELADAQDLRLLAYRNEVTRPLIDLLVLQMGGDPADHARNLNLATVLITGIERVATVSTNPYRDVFEDDHRTHGAVSLPSMIEAEAQLLALAIASRR